MLTQQANRIREHLAQRFVFLNTRPFTSDENKVVIHTDHKPQAFYDHLSEEAIDEHCIKGSTGSLAHDAHLATCWEYIQRAWETTEFLRILERAVESLVTGRAASSSTH